MNKYLLRLCFLIVLIYPTLFQNISAQPYTPPLENLQARKNFSDKRFGIFIHWGLYSMFAQGEWYMTNANIDCNEYAKSANAFYPHNFNAEEWVKAIKNAGAGYLCFTTRHHEGFSMWDTKMSDYNIMNTPYGQDIVKQLADACHKNDLGLHFYYSHLDWTREDYPIGRTGRKTGRKGNAPNWKNYYNFMNGQLIELLTNYGKVDCIWFDGVWDHDSVSIPFDWQLEEQYALIHKLQPACLIGNNHHKTPVDGEDIQIFERDVPGENKAGLSGQAVSPLPLETCQTMNGMWGYKIVDQNYKSVSTLIQLLVRTSSKGANLLLNIGPHPDGSLPAIALERLKDMGEWLRTYGETIYGTQAGNVETGGDSIVCTRKNNRLFIHILDSNVTQINIPLSAKKVKAARLLPNRQSLTFTYKNKKLIISNLSIPKDCIDYIIEVVES